MYVHFDPMGHFDPHVASTVAALARPGCAVVVCSTSDRSEAAAAAMFTGRVPLISCRNTGHDWGAYHEGLGYVLDRCRPESMTLMNDSVYVIPERL